MAQQVKGGRRHALAYRVARALVTPYFVRRFNFHTGAEPDIAGPFLLVINHVTELDFMLAGAAFSAPLAFVVGDTLLTAPVVGWLLRVLFGMIPKNKGIADAGTAMGILRRLRGGQNVCLFPEGNTCFDGRTGPFPQGTGSLARAVGVPLVTYRISGAYLALPRWGRGIRTGRTCGQVAGVYPPDKLKAMTPGEINALIARDLSVDAYADQMASPVAYRGKKRAEGLEHALYLCPGCGEIGSLAARDDAVTCSACGLRAVLDEYGAFEGGKPHPHIQAWTDSQRAWLHKRVLAAQGAPVLEDQDQTLYERGEGRQLLPAARGKLVMDAQELAVGEKRFALSELTSLEIYRKSILLLAASDGKRYQLHSKKPFNALKYRDMFNILKAERR